MDQDTLVNEQIESGERLIKMLVVEPFEVSVAFWWELARRNQH